MRSATMGAAPEAQTPRGHTSTPVQRDTDGRTDAAAVRAVLDRARVVLAMHIERDGMCGGCLDAWARLAPSPCEHRRWAVGVIERYGVPGMSGDPTAQRPAAR